MTFEKNAAGDLITHPLLGWTNLPLQMTAVLTCLRYAESQADIPHGGRTLQLTLTPAQALALSEELKRLAEVILHQNTPARLDG